MAAMAAAAAAVTTGETLATALRGVLQRVQAASGSATGDHAVRLVAVSKTKPVEELMHVYEAGQRHFGENYFVEIKEKAPLMPADIKWHFIGPLQSNKVKKIIEAVPNLYMVEGVCTVKLANLLNKACEEPCKAGTREPLRVLVQVNTSGEDSKSGCEPSGCVALAEHIVTNCPYLCFRGLMTIGSPGDETCFSSLVDCKQSILAAEIPNVGLTEDDFELSMGMSGDFETAIGFGATSVRVGSSIFGAREYANKTPTASATEMDSTANEPKEATSGTTSAVDADETSTVEATAQGSDDIAKPTSEK